MRLSVALVKRELSEFGGARHDVSALVEAARFVAKKVGHSPYEIYRLVCFNEPLEFTHSYGFLSATGRHYIDTFQDKYHSIVSH